MKSFRTKKNLAIALSVLLVAAIVVLCIALRQKSDADVDPTLTLVCTPADADGVCTVDVELTGLPDGGHYGAASIAVAFDPAQLTFEPVASAVSVPSTGSVLVRLHFRLADGVTESALTVTDAVLAAADETESLASAAATLTVAGGTVRRG